MIGIADLMLHCNKIVTTLAPFSGIGVFHSRGTEGVHMCVREIREEAEKYRRLANSIYNPPATAELEAHACELEERAARLEAAKRSPERPD